VFNRVRFIGLFWKLLIIFLISSVLAACSPVGVTQPIYTVSAVPTAAVAPSSTAATSSPVPSMDTIIPRPVSVEPGGEAFVLSADTVIYVQPDTDEVRAIGQYLADHLNPATGYSLQVQTSDVAPTSKAIYLTLNGADPNLGNEGYSLAITPDLVVAMANQPAGLFYAVQSLRQLLPPSIESASVQPAPWLIGTGVIKDYPRFAWRGAMLDVARHFFSVRDVTTYLDLLANYKINRLHLHLSDDQGWRIQINSWPNLALYGGSLQVGGGPGGYYSQSDYAYIVNYAASRYVTIVPEIDMPGHVTAALASYAELNCDGIAPDLFTGINVGFSSLCVNKDVTYTFLHDVIGEISAITPGAYFHVGGDEAQATSQPEYNDFIQRVQKIVSANGKQMVGWEEISQASLDPGAIAQHWNPTPDKALLAAQNGLQIIMSPADKAYMDMKYQQSTALGLDWAGYITVQTGYSWDPAAIVSGLPEKDILGVEAPLWTETLTSLADIEYMAFPRILGYAEIGWTPQSQRDWNEYRQRLALQGPRLQAMDVNYYASPEVPWP
jgi:hexosaminidase